MRAARAGETIPASAVEVPPNKAVAAIGGSSLASALVGLALYYSGSNPPLEIVALWMGIANAIVNPLIVYMTPHGAIMRKPE